MIVLNQTDIMNFLLVFILVMIRVSAFFLTVPVFSLMAMNTMVRVIFSSIITITIIEINQLTSQLAGQLTYDFIGLIRLTFLEVMLAITLGFIMRIVFTTAAVAGEYIAGAMGLSFASVVDPQTGGGTPVLAQFMTIFLTLIFLTLNGPVILVTIISDSFLILPLGGFQISYEALLRVALAGSYMFFSAVILMAPVGLSLFLTNIAIGFLTRLSPQMNIFSVGFPFSILLGLAMLAFSLPGMEVQMNNILLAAFEKTREILVLNDWIKG